jgi:hypothetical protein
MSQLARMFPPSCSITDHSWNDSLMYRPPWFQECDLENANSISPSDAIVCSHPLYPDPTGMHWHHIVARTGIIRSRDGLGAALPPM